MITFFARPASAAEAVDIRAKHENSIYIAGSTDVGVKLYQDALPYTGLIDISGIEELKALDAERRIIGALTTFAQLLRWDEENPETRLLRLMASQVAAAQIRNRATIGGNISNANPAADSLPVLAVLNARADVLDADGSWEMPLLEYLKRRKAGNTTALLRTIRYDALPEGARYAFSKVGRRTDLAIARVSAAVSVTCRGGLITDARVSLGAVSPVTGRFSNTECLLLGRRFNEETILLAGETAKKEAEAYIGGRSTAGYKLPVIKDLVQEMLRSISMREE